MSDTNVPLHEYLQEVVGYLQTLGKNIQKRTQHLLDSKINDSYLSSPEKVKRTAEKIYSICSLSKASIDKVEEGIKRSVDSYVQKTSAESLNHVVSPTKESNERRKTKPQSHREEEAHKTPTKRESDSNMVKDRSRRESSSSPKNTSHKTVDEKYNSPAKTFRNRHGVKFIKVKHQHRTLLIPLNVNLKDYLKCSVGVVPFSNTKFELDSRKIPEDTRYNSNKSRTKSKHSRSGECTSVQRDGPTRLTDGCEPESSVPRKSETTIKKSAAEDSDENNKHSQDLKRKFKNICTPESDSDEVFRRQTNYSDKHSSKKGLSINTNSCSEPIDQLSWEEINNKLTKAEIGNSQLLISGEKVTHQSQAAMDSCSLKVRASTDPTDAETKVSQEITEGDISKTADKINKEDSQSELYNQEEVNLKHVTMSGGSLITDETGHDRNDSDVANKRTLDVEVDAEGQKPHQSWEDSVVDELLTPAKIGAKEKTQRIELVSQNDNVANSDIEDANDLPTEENHFASQTDEGGEESEFSEIITSKKINTGLPSSSRTKTLGSSITDKELEAKDNHVSPETDVREDPENTHAEKASTELSENIKARSKKKNLSLRSSSRINNLDNSMSDKKLQAEENDIVLETEEDLGKPNAEKTSAKLSESVKNASKITDIGLQSSKDLDSEMSDRTLAKDNIDVITSRTTQENLIDSDKESDKLTDNDLPTNPSINEDVEEPSDSGSNKKSYGDESSLTVAECEKGIAGNKEQHHLELAVSEEVTQDKMIEAEPTKKLQSDPENEDIDSLSTNIDKDKMDDALDQVLEKPLIRCVNISNLLAPNVIKNVPQALIPRARKIVTFVDDPIHILDSPEKAVLTPVKNLSSILMKQKENEHVLLKVKEKNRKQNNNKNTQRDNKKLQEGDKNKPNDKRPKRKPRKIDSSTDSDSGDSKAAKDLLKGIKSGILEGTTKTWVNVVRDTFSWNTAGPLAKYGINTVYNELGKVCYKDSKNKEFELNESAKQAVLNSSSSSDEGASKVTSKRVPDNSGSSSLEEPGPGYSSLVEHKRKKKKFSKTKSHKKRDLSDSEKEIDSLLSLPKKRREKSRKNSSGSCDGPNPHSGDEPSNEHDEVSVI